MFSNSKIGIFLRFDRLKREKFKVIRRLKLRGIVRLALIAAFCAAVPMNMAVAQSIPAEQGSQNVTKQSDAKKKIIKSKSVSAKFARPIYLGGAPYICTPSGFGHTSQCFLR